MPADPTPDSIEDRLAFFRDLGITDLYLDARPGAASPVAGSFPDLPSLQKFLAGCPRCKLSKGRTNIVFGQGNPKAELMFVGEAPGRDEDEQGLAFVGRAGQLLTKIIEAIGMKREDVFIANCLKCRPPENRNPERDEIEACRPFLEEQIRLISPKVIVTLGTFAAQAILDRLLGRQPEPFHYCNKGSLAVIGRAAGVADFGRLHVHGKLQMRARATQM